MYCPSCGAAVAQGLSYCNYCGAKLSGATGEHVSKSPEVKPELLVSAMVGLFVLGLPAIIVLMGVMKAVLGLPVELVLAIAAIIFLVMLALEGVLLRLLFGRKRGVGAAGDTVLSKGQATRELDAAQAHSLPEAVPSVTEHTTRTFEPIYNERTSK